MVGPCRIIQTEASERIRMLNENAGAVAFLQVPPQYCEYASDLASKIELLLSRASADDRHHYAKVERANFFRGELVMILDHLKRPHTPPGGSVWHLRSDETVVIDKVTGDPQIVRKT